MKAIENHLIPGGQLLAPPALLWDEKGALYAVYSTSQAEEGDNLGQLSILKAGDTLVPLTPERGAYGPPAAGIDPRIGRIAAACTEYRDGEQRLLLATVDPNLSAPALIPVTPFGKIDNPALSFFADSLYLFWEARASGSAAIHGRRFDLSGETPSGAEEFTVTESTERAYRPQVLTCGEALILAYESFFAGRYHLLLRTLSAPSEISAPREIGFSEENDLEPSLALWNGDPLVMWENSSPLYKGFEWISPKSATVIIPGFGHGWRVLTRAGVRQIDLDAGDIAACAPFSADESAPRVRLDDTESAGAPRILADPSGQAVAAFLTINDRPKVWNIALRDLHNTADAIPTGLSMRDRVRPAAAADPHSGRIAVAGRSAPDGDWCIRLFPPFSTASPQVENAAIPLSRPFIEVGEPARSTIEHAGRHLSLFWGDLHMHTNFSVCSLHPKFHCCELEEKYRFCRDVGGLDFAMVTDHDVMDDHSWNRTRQTAHLGDLDGDFVAFAGVEWTSSQDRERRNWGHYNILYRDDGPILRTTSPGTETIDEVWSHLQPGQALTIPHHPGDATHTLDWSRFNPAFEPLVEIFQVRGSYESDDCLHHPEQYGRKNVKGHSIQDGLAAGYRFGFTGGGEHEGVGVTALFAESLTRDALFDALRARQVYATTGARIFVDVRMGDAMMGGELTWNGAPLPLAIEARGTVPIQAAWIVSNGKTVHRWEVGREDLRVSWEDQQNIEKDETRYYYVVILQEDGEMAWTSPIFVSR